MARHVKPVEEEDPRVQTVQRASSSKKGTTHLPAYPWEEVGADLFQLRGVTYLLVVDYFSNFPELIKLTSTTAPSVINALKAVFARHGIPSC